MKRAIILFGVGILLFAATLTYIQLIVPQSPIKINEEKDDWISPNSDSLDLYIINPADSILQAIDSAYYYTLKKDSISHLELRVLYNDTLYTYIRKEYNRLEGKRNWYVNKIDSFKESLRYWNRMLDGPPRFRDTVMKTDVL